MNFILFFTFVWISVVVSKKKPILILLGLSIVIIAFVLFVPINLRSMARNKYAVSTSTFTVRNIIFPYQNSKYKTDFERIENEHFYYYAPKDIDFFWGTGNGSIPCINKEQIDYFEQNYNVKPQMRSGYLKDGFYTKHTLKN